MGRIIGCVEHGARNFLGIEEIAAKRKKIGPHRKFAVQSAKSNVLTGKEVGFKGSNCRKRKNNYSSLLFHFHRP